MKRLLYLLSKTIQPRL